MQRYVHLFIISLFTFKQALAAEVVEGEHGAILKISPTECRRLIVTHRPRDDVNYKPGVDVYGNAVVPADVPSQYPLALPDEIALPIEIDITSFFAGSPPFVGFLDVAEIGEVTIDMSDGGMTFNGEPMTNQQIELVRKNCQDYL